MNSSLRINLLIYFSLLAAHVALTWLLPYFPTQDGPCHIYNLLILHDLLHGGKEFGKFYTYTLHPVPNLGFDLLTYPLINSLPPLAAEKTFITIYIVLLGMSLPLLLKTFERTLFPYSYFVFPVVFNYSLLMGFYSYTITVPLFILAFCLAWKIRNSSVLCKFVCYNLSGLILFYFHLIPAVFFLISLISISLSGTGGYRRNVRQLLLLFATILPFALELLIYLSQGSKQPPPDFSYLLSVSRINRLITDLLSFSTINLSRWQLVPGCLYISLVVSFVYSPLKEIYLAAKANKHEVPPPVKTVLILASLLTIIYLVAPFRIGDGSNFNERLPWVILLVLPPLMRLPHAAIFQRAGAALVAGCAAGFLLCNAVVLWEESTKIERYLRGLSAHIPNGAYVMGFKSKPPDYARVDTLLHAASYYGIFQRCIDISNYEAGFHYFLVHFKDTIPTLPPESQIISSPATIRWVDYPFIQYVLGWEIDNNERMELDDFFHVIWREGPLTVWQRNQQG